MSKNKVIITLTIERDDNEKVSKQVKVKGSGFHYHELIGFMQMTSYDFAQNAKDHEVKTEIKTRKAK